MHVDHYLLEVVHSMKSLVSMYMHNKSILALMIVTYIAIAMYKVTLSICAVYVSSHCD